MWRPEDGTASLASLATPPPHLQLRPSGLADGQQGVWSRAALPAGTRFGPYLGKWVLEPQNEEFAWEVRMTIFSYFTIFVFLPPLTVDTISIV